MTEADKRYYERMAIADERRKRALDKARNRGDAAAKWFADGNKLTKETKPEFDALMRRTDKNFESK